MRKIPEDLCRSDIEFLMHEWIMGQHSARNREILSRRLFDGITYEALAEEFEMSDRQIKDIVYKCEKKIFKHLPKK